MQDNDLIELLTSPTTIGIVAAFYALMQVGGLYAAVHAVFHARSSQGSTAWAIALVATPDECLEAAQRMRKCLAGL